MGLMMVSQRSSYYPSSGVARMSRRFGRRWADLVTWITRLPGGDPQSMAFTRTLRQIGRRPDTKTPTHGDPFCTRCAHEAISAFEGSEDDLLRLYFRNLHQITEALSTMRRRDDLARTGTAIA